VEKIGTPQAGKVFKIFKYVPYIYRTA